MKPNTQSLWLACGMGLVAAVLGFMVGASKTSVVGIAIPAIFGLVITAFSFISGTNFEKNLENIAASLEKSTATTIHTSLRALEREVKRTPEFIGKLLIVFTLSYAIGLIFGTKARINAWLAPAATAPTLPWARNKLPPPTTSDAIEWISLQENLLELGYTKEQIDQIYSIQVSEWKNLESSRKSGSNMESPKLSQEEISRGAQDELEQRKLEEAVRLRQAEVFRQLNERRGKKDHSIFATMSPKTDNSVQR